MTTDTQTDTFEHGIGVLGTHDNKQTDDIQISDPVSVSGVGQAQADDIIGELRGVRHSPGMGLLFEGEVTDRDIAEKVANGYLSVSPSVARSLGEFDPQREARPVDSVAGLRDAAIVGRGQPGASVELGSNPAVGTLARDALSRAFDADMDTLKDVAGVSFTGTADGELDESEIDEDFGDHYLYGEGENKEDYSYPVVDADGNLRRGNVEAAHQLGCRGQCPDAETHDSRLRELAQEFDPVPEWAADNDTMSANEAKATLADEYGMDIDELERRLATDDTDHDDDTVTLVES